MAAPMKTVFRDFGQNFLKFQLPFPLDLTQGRIILCKQCTLRNLFRAKQYKARERGYLSENSFAYSAPVTSRLRGDKPSPILNIDSAQNDSYPYLYYCRSSGTNSLFGRNHVYNVRCRPISSITRLSCIQRENVSVPDKTDGDPVIKKYFLV